MVSGGYYLTHRAARDRSPELLPERLISASNCICQFFPDSWAIEWASESADERLRKAATFGISGVDLPKVIAWATASMQQVFGWPNVFYTLEAAREAREGFLAQDSEVVIFGLGLHDSHVAEFLEAAKPSPSLSAVSISRCIGRMTAYRSKCCAAASKVSAR